MSGTQLCEDRGKDWNFAIISQGTNEVEVTMWYTGRNIFSSRDIGGHIALKTL